MATPRKTTAAKKTTAAARRRTTDVEQPGGVLTASDQEWLDRQAALADDAVIDPAQAETLVEDIPDGAIAVPLGPHGDIVHLLPRREWRTSALTALHEGDLERWASMCLHKPDYETIWVGLDPTIGEVQDMLRAWQDLTGEDLGKAQVQRGSLRNGRRR